jgi:predicted ATPase
MQISREQKALAWELRAAMSLVRLRKRQGKATVAELAEARMLLSNLYERFTEGFIFPDLQEAAALIDEAG